MKRGNMADLNAKESTQETLVTLIGMSLGISLANYVNYMEPIKARNSIWLIFLSLTGIHVWANYKGVMLLRLNTLNRQRTEDVLQSTLTLFSQEMTKLMEYETRDKQNIYFRNASFSLVFPSPDQVSESIVQSTKKLLFRDMIRLGVSITETCDSMAVGDIMWLIKDEFALDPYILGMDCKRNRICVTLKKDANEKDELMALSHALLIETYLRENRQQHGNYRNRNADKDLEKDIVIM